MDALWYILLEPQAKKELDSIGRDDEELWDEAISAIAQLMEGPSVPGADPMRDHPGYWRLRLSKQYRVVYRVSQKQRRIVISRIRHRSEVYEGMD